MEWLEQAACKADPSLHLLREFMRTPSATDRAQISQAKATCQSCPVLKQCVNWVMQGDEDPTPSHVTGGMTPTERTYLRVRTITGLSSINENRELWRATAKHLRSLTLARSHQQAACGTRSGYMRHRRLGEVACDPCREAHNAYVRVTIRTPRNGVARRRSWAAQNAKRRESAA
jgi:hypothetical protein